MLRAIVLASMLAPSLACAQDTSEAERLFNEGVALAQAERWGEAAEYFRRAGALVDRPSITCNLGVALYRLGLTQEARATLERCRTVAAGTAYAESYPEQIRAAEEFLAELERAVARLRIDVSPHDAVVSIDGEEIAGEGSPRTIEINPGRHTIAITAPGHRTFRESGVSVLSGATVELEAHLEALPARPARLVVESLRGARIRVDGELVGIGRIEEELPAGRVAVRVEVEGHAPLVRDVELSEGEVVRIDALFRAAGDVTGEWWFWTVLGLGALAVAGAAIAIGVALTPEDPLQDFGGNADFIFTPLIEW